MYREREREIKDKVKGEKVKFFFTSVCLPQVYLGWNELLLSQNKRTRTPPATAEGAGTAKVS